MPPNNVILCKSSGGIYLCVLHCIGSSIKYNFTTVQLTQPHAHTINRTDTRAQHSVLSAHHKSSYEKCARGKFNSDGCARSHVNAMRTHTQKKTRAVHCRTRFGCWWQLCGATSGLPSSEFHCTHTHRGTHTSCPHSRFTPSRCAVADE